MKKILVLAYLLLSGGIAFALQDVVVQGAPCQIEVRPCYNDILLRQTLIFAKLQNLTIKEEKFGESVVKQYSYKENQCGLFPQDGELVLINNEKYMKAEMLFDMLSRCISPIKINNLSSPVIRFDQITFNLSGNVNRANTRYLISTILGRPISALNQATNSTLNSKNSWKLVDVKYKFNLTRLSPNSLYVIIKNSDSQRGSLSLEISDTNKTGKMLFYSDSAELRFKPSLKGFENFKHTDAVMIKLTGRFDRNIFDLSPVPKLTVLKGVPVNR